MDPILQTGAAGMRDCVPYMFTKRCSHSSHKTSHSPTPQSLLSSVHLEIPTVQDMEDVGAVLSMDTVRGDVLLLGGDLGAGKTCFSRGFVRARTGLTDIRVTSPTYLLSNTYPVDNGDLIIHHMDLYRLSDGKEKDLEPLNLDYVFQNCISLIEWPSRLGRLVPSECLEITFKIIGDAENNDSDENTRILTLTPHGQRWEQQIKKMEEDGYLDDLMVEYDSSD